MTKSRNQKMTILFIWLGVIAGILGIVSLAGFRIYSGKAKEESERKATEDRKSITQNILNSEKELRKTMNDENTNILNQIDSAKIEIIEKSKLAKNKKPRLKFEFVHPTNVAYKVKNISTEAIAENVLVSFAIFDLDNKPLEPIPIKTAEISYINPNSTKGPWTILGKDAITNHRYFGIMYLECKGGEKLKTYWIYIEKNNLNNSFYAERNDKDTFQIQFGRIAENDELYLDQLVPKEVRNYIK